MSWKRQYLPGAQQLLGLLGTGMLLEAAQVLWDGAGERASFPVQVTVVSFLQLGWAVLVQWLKAAEALRCLLA